MKRGYAQIIALFVSVIMVVAVGIPTISALTYRATNQVSATNYNITGVTNLSTSTLPEFTSGACTRGAFMTRAITNNTASANLINGIQGVGNWTLNNATGVITWTDVDNSSATFGSGANVSYTCSPPTYLDSGAARTVTTLIPLILAVAGIVVVVVTVL